MPKFVISIELKDKSVSKAEIARHIGEAIGHWGEANTPDTPFFPSNIIVLSVNNFPDFRKRNAKKLDPNPG